MARVGDVLVSLSVSCATQRTRSRTTSMSWDVKQGDDSASRRGVERESFDHPPAVLGPELELDDLAGPLRSHGHRDVDARARLRRPGDQRGVDQFPDADEHLVRGRGQTRRVLVDRRAVAPRVRRRLRERERAVRRRRPGPEVREPGGVGRLPLQGHVPALDAPASAAIEPETVIDVPNRTIDPRPRAWPWRSRRARTGRGASTGARARRRRACGAVGRAWSGL